jgi:hypothetical protein
MSEFLINQTEGGKTQISVVLDNETALQCFALGIFPG